MNWPPLVSGQLDRLPPASLLDQSEVLAAVDLAQVGGKRLQLLVVCFAGVGADLDEVAVVAYCRARVVVNNQHSLQVEALTPDLAQVLDGVLLAGLDVETRCASAISPDEERLYDRGKDLADHSTNVVFAPCRPDRKVEKLSAGLEEVVQVRSPVHEEG